jgi:hypothetical protein
VAEHTPGEWRPKHGRVFADLKRKGCMFKHGVPVCELSAAFKDSAEMAANERLIAAAPDLLAACKEALWACRGDEYDPDRYDRALDLCKAAVLRAEKERHRA